MRVEGFVIHLERAVERREQAMRLVRKSPVETHIFKAIDARDLSAHQIEQVNHTHKWLPHYLFNLSPGEIACFMSHRGVWQAILDSGIDAGLIFEDDVELLPQFPAVFAFARSQMVAGDYIRFPDKERETPAKVIAQQNDICLFVPHRTGLRMQTQLVTRDAAKQLLAATHIFDRPVDNAVQMYWKTGVRLICAYPVAVNEQANLLGGSVIGKSSGLVQKIRREVLRPIYRAQISLLDRVYRNQVRGITAM